MSNVVTSTAIPQSDLYAVRQQTFQTERQSSASSDAAPPQVSSLPASEGPSRPRVDFAPLSISQAGDGAAANTGADSQSAANNDAGAANANPSANAPADAGAEKQFAAIEAHASTQQYANRANAASGAASAETPKKFYGQGAEVVVGAGNAVPQASEKPVVHKTPDVVQERGTAEAKQHDKVAQAEAEQAHQQSAGEKHAGHHSEPHMSYYEKGQQIAAAMSIKKTGIVEVAAYGSSTATTTALAIVMTPTDVTA